MRSTDQFLHQYRAREPDGYRTSTRSDALGDTRGSRQNDSQRPGPEACGKRVKCVRQTRREHLHLPEGIHQQKNRLTLRPSFQPEYLSDGGRLERICRQSVHGIRGDRNYFSGADGSSGLFDRSPV